jgi:hypothetical protein
VISVLRLASILPGGWRWLVDVQLCGAHCAQTVNLLP